VSAAAAAAPELEVRGVEKSFNGVRALKGVSLRIDRGEARALVGANGAGKSTLINVVCGAVQPDSGTVLVGGEEVAIRSPHVAIELGIGTVHQHDRLVPNLSVAQNLQLGHEPTRTPARWLTKAPAGSLSALELVGLADRAGDLVEGMTLAQRQLVSIARAVSLQPRLLILDEPTASLTPLETSYLIEVIDRLRRQGTALIYVTHRLQELTEVVDRVTVLRDGCVVAERAPDVPEPELVELIAGEGVVANDEELVDERRRLARERGNLTASEPLLSVSGLGDSAGAFEDVSFELRRGEVLGMVGLPDAGVTQLVETIAGARRSSSGTIALAEAPFRARSPRAASRRGVGYLAGDRARCGVIPNSDVAETIALSALPRLSRGGLLSFRRLAASTRRLLRQCQVDAADPGMPITALSGGNQQKALFARVLATEPRVVVCEDPTAGVDVAGRESLYELVADLCERGGAVIWSGSDLREVATICDRVLVLWRGSVVASLERQELDERALMVAQFNQGQGEAPVGAPTPKPGGETG